MKNVLMSACLLGVNCRYNGIVKANPQAQALAAREDLRVIPVCPEQLGGLSTPRLPSECRGDGVYMKDGSDVTENYGRGAGEALKLAKFFDCDLAILKARSPSCGRDRIYDGSFTGTLTEGDGITVRTLKAAGIRVITEEELVDLQELF